MLEKIREGSQGTIVKVVLGAVILSFALAGVGSYLGNPTELLAAKVNGQKIYSQMLENAVRQERALMQQNNAAQFEALADNPAFQQQIRAKALEQLIIDALLDQAVAEHGLLASDDQVREEIKSIPGFQIDGVFNNDLYLSSISREGYSAAGFRELVRTDLSRRQFVTGVLNSEFVLPNEVTRIQSLLDQTRSIRYWKIDTAKLAANVIPTEEQVQAYFDAHQYLYQQPEMVSVEFLRVDADQLATQIEITDQQVADYYDANADLYKTTGEVKASHIMLENTDEGREIAAKVQAELAAGADFGELAKTYSVDTFSAEQNGDLGWFSRGIQGDEFDDAVFGLTEEGAVSDLVETPYGLHLIQLTGIKPEAVKSLAEVAPSIKEELQHNEALEQYYQLQEEVTNLAFEMPESLEQIASETGLKVEQTDTFARTAPPAIIAQPAVLAEIFSEKVLQDGMNSDPIETGEGKLIVVRVKDHEAARTKTLDEVKPEVARAVSLESGNEAANEIAEAYIAKLKAGETPLIDADEPITLLSADAFTRDAMTLERAVRDRAFAMPKPQQSSEFATVNASGYVAVVALDDVQEAEQGEADGRIQQVLEQNQVQIAYMALVNALREQADIVYINQAEESDSLF